MNLERLLEKFINDYRVKAPYVDKDELYFFLFQMKNLIIKNKDKTPEEIIDTLLEDNIRKIDDIRKKYGVPGYTVGIKVGGITIKLYGGTINYLGEEMPSNALFDIASMTKFYTQVICYHLMSEGYFSYNDRINSLDDRFVNLGDLTVKDILTFGTTFTTLIRISNQKRIIDAKDTLFNAKVVEKNKYNYNDIGMMIMKEVMERVTNISYNDLLNKYIVKPYNLTDTHVIVPKCKFKLITATPNFRIGHINDLSANALGGYSGHAGIFTTNDDLIKFMMGVYSNVPNITDAYTPSKLNDAIGIMGNVYVSNPKGLSKSFVDVMEPSDTIAIQGSTRVNANASSDSFHDILFNPSSMSIEEAEKYVAIINEKRKKEGKNPINPIKSIDYFEEGKLVQYKLIDARELLPLSEMENVIRRNAITVLKLRFFNEVLNEYSKDYNKSINYIRNTNNKN